MENSSSKSVKEVFANLIIILLNKGLLSNEDVYQIFNCDLVRQAELSKATEGGEK